MREKDIEVVMEKQPAEWKYRLCREFKLFLFLFVFFFFAFCSFSMYRMLVVEEVSVNNFHYWYVFIKALILAKIFSIGRVLRLGERFLDYPLIIPTLYKSLIFCLFALFLTILERFITGIFDGRSLAEIYAHFLENVQGDLLGRVPILFTISIPLFSFLEICRVFGGDRVFALFFQKNTQHNK